VAGKVRYVILSDLHLGAENSILTNLRAGTTLADSRHPSPVLTSLVECLRSIVSADVGEPPTLIVAGDLVELALASPTLSLPVVAQFAAALAVGEPVVRDEVIFVPGNHDHHLWEMSRERMAADFLRAGTPRDQEPATWHTSPMFLDQKPRYDAPLLEDAVHYLRSTGRAQVRVVYPDLALTSPDGQRAVFVTHGHYMEQVGTLFSAMARLADPSSPPLDNVDLIERENWAWVDFFWGSMGRSTRTGAVIEKLYDSMQDPRAVQTMLGGLALGVTKHQNPWLAKLEGWGLRRVVGRIVTNRLHERERNNTDEVLAEGSRRGLSAYLTAMRNTFERQWERPLPADVTMVVGHTHKPFSEWWDEPAWPARGMRVFNTGGWVVDHAVPQPLQGGAVILVSDELDVVSLRIYQQVGAPSLQAITVETVRPMPGGEAFAAHIRSLVKSDAAPWSTFAAAVDQLVSERRDDMRKILEGELKLLRD
jgi:Calcineurin-like phosphoesterase